MLLAAKAKMNGAFEANRVKPTDKNFEWDKRVDFEPPSAAAPSDWDSEDD
jgi:hypothetical protein